MDDRDLHDILYIPSLLHAVSTNSWAYMFWLIGSGSSLEEKVTPELDIWGAIMATRSLETIGFFFKGCRDLGGGATLLPSLYREAGGYFVFRLFYESRNLGIRLTHRLDWPRKSQHEGRQDEESQDEERSYQEFLDEKRQRKKERSDRNMECFKYLLRKYPDAANSLPRPSLLGMIPRQQLSILHQAAYPSPGRPDYLWSVIEGFFCRAEDLTPRRPNYRRLVVEAWTNRETRFPRQDLFSYLWFSPMDALGATEIHSLLQMREDLNLSHMCPSLFWFPMIMNYMMVIISGLIFGFFRLESLWIIYVESHSWTIPFIVLAWEWSILGMIGIFILELSTERFYLIFKKHDRQLWGRSCLLPIISVIAWGLALWFNISTLRMGITIFFFS